MSLGEQFLLAQSAWAFGESALLRWTMDQASQLVEKLCGVRPRLVESLAEPFCIVVGSPTSSPLVGQAVAQGLIETAQLGPDDYLIRRTTLNGQDALVIAGQNDRAAMYGVFDFFERLGCRFLISRDIVPATDPGRTIPPLDLVGHTDNAWRGLWISFCFATNSMMSIPDYERLFDQMAKMRLNRISFYHFENEPFIDFSYKGERKLIGDISHPESGYISYGRHFSGSYRVQDIPVGREVFDRRRVAPLEFQHVRSSAEALDTGKAFLRALIDAAAERGMTSWIAFLPTFVPMNMIKYTRRMPRPHLHWSGLVSCCDPVVDEINRCRIQSIVESFPNLEGLFLGIPEGYYPDPYPDSQALIEKEFPKYAEALALHKRYWGKFWPDEDLLEAHLRRDIGFVEILRRTIPIAQEIAPGVRLGVITVCKAYLLTYLHQILPQEMPFADIESRSLWTLDGAPLHLFKGMRGRECIVIPRAVDDGSMAGLQFNLELYDKDRFCASARENGTSGLIIQTTHIRGNEHNVKFLAEGMWDDTLTPSAFYRDYAEALFGSEAAAPVVEAYRTLEENEEFLGGRGMKNMPWNKVPMEIEVLRSFKGFQAPFYEAPVSRQFVQTCRARASKFDEALEYLSAAQDLFEEALTRCQEPGKGELVYLLQRNEAYARHLRTLILLAGAYERLFDAFALLDSGVAAFKKTLGQAVDLARQAGQEAARSAEGFARCAEHPTDLGVLWAINSSMVIGTRVLVQYLDNVAAFYNGEEYWNAVDWELLFGECPFPGYELERVTAAESTTYEPG